MLTKTIFILRRKIEKWYQKVNDTVQNSDRSSRKIEIQGKKKERKKERKTR